MDRLDKDKDYDLKVLKMIIDKYLDEETRVVTEESIIKLENNCDQVVWDIVTRIYIQSGHKIELNTVKYVVDSRIAAMKHQLTAEKERIDEKNRYGRERIACQAALEETRLRNEVTSVIAEFGGDEGKAIIFIKTRKIICNQLCVDAKKVTLHSHLSNDLGADNLDSDGLVMDLEQEFDIEICDEEAENELPIYNSRRPTIWNISEGSDFDVYGANCTVQKFVDLIYKKVSYPTNSEQI
ncbi:phosphopantetheine-binding protein [Chamaesiphon sp. VAR_48_metabat_135_sub]|uniref:phosphopantetheine-binding protein n=1 Tax=Chamaesiphon sp. VAR_48_metabat_135_sub TaxID=2964699 RepID=UPI0037C06063